MTVPLTYANGTAHPYPPAGVPLLPAGPVRPWPRTVIPQPPPGARLLPVVTVPRQDPPAATPALRVPWWLRIRAIDGDTVITWAMAATVALVAVDAAIVSYSHIYGLATGSWGSGAETGIQARLLPLSIDGVIIEASLVKLHAARHKIARKQVLATFMLLLGVIATVGANVTHGLPSALLPPVAHTVIMALLSGWPAGVIIGSVEMAMGLVRDRRTLTEGDAKPRQRTHWRPWRRRETTVPDAPPPAAASTPAPVSAATTEPLPPARQEAVTPGHAGRRQPRRPRKTPARQPKTDGSKLAAAKALLAAKPSMTVSDLMAAGVSEGTARRAKRESGS